MKVSLQHCRLYDFCSVMFCVTPGALWMKLAVLDRRSLLNHSASKENEVFAPLFLILALLLW